MADGTQLNDDELAAWRSFVEMHHRLERHLARRLQREFGLSDSDFEVLVNLSEAPGYRMRAFELGQATRWKKSRLSHHLSRMEKRGLVRREVMDRSDARYPDVVLTDAGRNAIESSAPANEPGYGRSSSTCLGLSGSPCCARHPTPSSSQSKTPRNRHGLSPTVFANVHRIGFGRSAQFGYAGGTTLLRPTVPGPQKQQQDTGIAEAGATAVDVRVGGRLTLVGLTGFEPATT